MNTNKDTWTRQDRARGTIIVQAHDWGVRVQDQSQDARPLYFSWDEWRALVLWGAAACDRWAPLDPLPAAPPPGTHDNAPPQ